MGSPETSTSDPQPAVPAARAPSSESDTIGALHRFALLLAGGAAANALLRHMLLIAVQLTGAQHATILLLDERGERVRGRVALESANIPPLELVAGPMMNKGLAGWAARARRSALVRDTEQDRRWLPGPGLGDLRSAIVVPLLRAGYAHGIVTLGHESPGHFDDDHLRIVEILAAQAATVAQGYPDAPARPLDHDPLRVGCDPLLPPDRPVRQEIVALWAELRGLTAAGPNLALDTFFDDILRVYFQTMADVVQQRHGRVDTIIGNTLLAVFAGAGGSDSAVRAALEMRSATRRLREHWHQHLGIAIGDVDIGIARGWAIVGRIAAHCGASRVVGDVVGQAARLRALARGGEILIAAAVVEGVHLDDAFVVEALPPLRLGAAAPQPLFLIRAPDAGPSPLAGAVRRAASW